MATAAPEIEMQMQSALFDLRRFLATCVKTTQGKEEVSGFLLRRSAAQHTSGLKYFGQSKVEDAATGVAKVNVKKRVRFREPNGTESWPAQFPIGEQTTIVNQQLGMHIPICLQKAITMQPTEGTEESMPTEGTEECMSRHRQQLPIEALNQLGTQLHDVAGAGDLTPRSTLNDMHMMYKDSSSACRALPKSALPASKRLTPDLKHLVTPEIIGGGESGMSVTTMPDHMLTSDAIDNGDTTPLPEHLLTYTFESDELDDCDITPLPDHILAYRF